MGLEERLGCVIILYRSLVLSSLRVRRGHSVSPPLRTPNCAHRLLWWSPCSSGPHVRASQASILNSSAMSKNLQTQRRNSQESLFPRQLTNENKIGDIPVVWPSCWHYISWHLKCQTTPCLLCIFCLPLDIIRAKEIISITVWLVSCSHFNTVIHSLPLNLFPWCMKWHYEVPGTMGFDSSAKSF